MDDVSIAKLKKQSIIIFPNNSILFDIYNHFIRPQILVSNNLPMHQQMSLAKITLFVKKDGQLQLVNNFEIFYLIKTYDTNQILLDQMISTVQINGDQFRIDTVFYELIDIIAKYQKLLDIEAIYQGINDFLTPELNQQLFRRNIFSILTFCSLIGIHEQTYYKRCKKEAIKGIVDVKKYI